MIVTLEDNTKIHLWGIVQSNWGVVRKGEFVTPFDGSATQALNRISKMAGTLIPASWPDAPLVFVESDYEALRRKLMDGSAPHILTVGMFICNHAFHNSNMVGSILHLAWNDERISFQLNPTNLEAIQKIKWADYARDFNW